MTGIVILLVTPRIVMSPVTESVPSGRKLVDSLAKCNVGKRSTSKNSADFRSWLWSGFRMSMLSASTVRSTRVSTGRSGLYDTRPLKFLK